MEDITASGRETWKRFRELQISEEQCSILEWTSWSNDYRRENQGPKRLSDLLKITQLVSGRTGGSKKIV